MLLESSGCRVFHWQLEKLKKLNIKLCLATSCVPSVVTVVHWFHSWSPTVSDMSQERNQVNTLPNRIEARHRIEIVLAARQIWHLFIVQVEMFPCPWENTLKHCWSQGCVVSRLLHKLSSCAILCQWLPIFLDTKAASQMRPKKSRLVIAIAIVLHITHIRYHNNALDEGFKFPL